MDINNYLRDCNQVQLLTFYDSLSNNDKKELINDINNIDINMMNNLYNNSYKEEHIDINKISPLKYVIGKDVDDKYIDIGKEYIKNNKYGVVILAGGVGSRVGLNIPKGCIELNINNKSISLFESYINQLKKVYDELNVYVDLFIMTSFINHDNTIKYFEEHNYFNYPKDKIHFFMQGKLPIMNVDGKILLKDKSHILYGPNGNGNVFNSLKNANLIDYIKSNGLDKILFVTVDNILSKLVDYKVIGYSIGNKILTKTLYKEDKDGKDWVFCLYNNKPFILPKEFITEDIKNDESYKDINITYHIIDVDEISKYSNIDLRYHRTYKNNKYLDIDGCYKEDKAFKFEQYIFDAFNYSDDMILYRVEKDEFAPIKTQEDIDKINKQV